MITDPLFYAVAVPAVLLMAIGKGGFGAGVGLIAVPAIALTVPPLQAAGIMLPILCFMDLFAVWAYRRHWDRRIAFSLFPAAALGILLAALLADRVEEDHIRLIIGAIAVLFTLDFWLGRRGHQPAKSPSRLKGGFWAAISGFTSFVGHAGGPPLSVYLLPLKLDKTVYVGTTAVFFAAVNYAKLAPYAWLGQLGPGNLLTALVLSPLCPLGMWLGVRLHTRVPIELFYRFCYGLIFLAGCKLLWDGTAGVVSGSLPS